MGELSREVEFQAQKNQLNAGLDVGCGSLDLYEERTDDLRAVEF